MRVVFAVLVALALLGVPYAQPAYAAPGVDLSTSLFNPIAAPVPDSPVQINVAVANDGAATATNVVVEVPVPAGATVIDRSDNCSVAAAVVACTFSSLSGNNNQGANVYLTFGATGVYAITSSARADQPDSNGNSTDHLDVTVVPEHADLEGQSESSRVVLGNQTTFTVQNQFGNRGPTSAGEATVSGSVTGGATIVPASFHFDRSFFGSGNLADDECAVTATTFTCAPVFSGGVFYAPEPSVYYDVTLPTTPGTVVAAATLTGRADPNHANDTSTVTIEVDEPAAEIYTQIVSVVSAIPSQVPFRVEGPVVNAGEIDAHDVVAVLEAPSGWAIAVPSGPLPPGVACSVIASPHAMRCTRNTLSASEWWSVDALVTPPPGSGSGTVSLAVSTTTPESGIYPNDASTTIQFAPGAGTRTLDIEPDTALADGDAVTFTGIGFAPNQTVFYCEAVVTGTTPQGTDCGVPFQSTTTDANGAFNVTVTVERFLVVTNVGVVDCAQPQTACGIGADDVFASGGSAVIQPMVFTPQPPVADPFDARIAGTVTDGSSAPVPGTKVFAYRSTDRLFPSLQTTTDTSGNYVLENAEPGIAYRLRFGAPVASNLVTEWYGGAGSAGVPSRSSAFDVQLTAAQPVVDADAVLAVAGTLTGTVLGPGGVPLANVNVWAYRSQDRWVGSYAVTTASDGTYRIDGVQPDTEVRIRFGPPAGSGLVVEWFDNAPTRRAATPLLVGAGGSTAANAQLGAGP